MLTFADVFFKPSACDGQEVGRSGSRSGSNSWTVAEAILAKYGEWLHENGVLFQRGETSQHPQTDASLSDPKRTRWRPEGYVLSGLWKIRVSRDSKGLAGRRSPWGPAGRVRACARRPCAQSSKHVKRWG